MTTPTPETTAPEAPRAGRLTWRRVIFGGLLGLLGGFGIVHAIGGTMSAMIAAGSAATGAAGYSVYKYPHVRRHFWGPWSGKNRESKGRKGFSEAWQRNWRKGFKSPGNPFRNAKNPFRKHSGPGGAHARRGAGSMFRRRGGAGHGRVRSALRSPGANRRARAGSGSRSRHSGTGTGRRAGIFRRPGRGSGTSRRSSPGSGRSRRGPGAFGRFRRHSGTTGRRPPAGHTRRRTPLHPFGGRRTTPRSGRTRPRSIRHPFGGRRTGPRTAPAGRSRRRTPFHPFGGRRTGPRTPRPGRTRTRSFRHPFGGRRTGPRPRRLSWLRGAMTGLRHPFRVWKWALTPPSRRPSRSAFRASLGNPGLVRRGWRRVFGTPSSPRLARRGWHRVFGTPAARKQRRRAARARRANARNRRRRARGTYGRRARWYAPWRGRSRRGRISLRHRIGNRIGNWRAGRRRLRGLLSGTGRTPLRLRLRHWFGRRTWAPRWARMRRRLSPSRWRRNRRMPRALLGGRHRAGAQSAALHRFGRTRLGRWFIRRDRRRRQQWAARQGRGRATPVPDTTRRPVTPTAAGSNGHRPAGRRTRGGTMADPQAMAEQIREMGSEEFQDSNHAHEVLTTYSEVIRAVEEGLHNLAAQVEDAPGITDDYAEAARETAGQMSGVADGLHEKIGEGIVRS